MKVKQKLVVAGTSLTLSIAAALLPSEESMASILPVVQYNHSVRKHLVVQLLLQSIQALVVS
ncbi:MAG: hypothetical protein V7L22_23860 [Nostoc sp.]|uniref:hypothetical protein n=1 Tax=Nostoc sp. TaxID=1180 RepID=UPI002FF44702